MNLSFTVPRKLLLLLVLPLAFIFSFIGLLSELRGISEDSTAAIADSRKVIAQTQFVLRELSDAETGMYGYALTRAKESLAPYRNARQPLPLAFDQLLLQVKDNPVQVAAARRLQDRSTRVLATLQSIEAAVDATPHVSTDQLIPVLRKSSSLMAELRSDGNVLLGQEERNDSALEAVLQDRWDLIDRALLTGAVVATILSLLLGLLLGRDISIRLSKLARNARRFASGQELLPPVGGSDEIGQLDMAFHDMADALLQAGRRERALMENAADVICAFTVDGKVSAVSRAAKAVWGYAPEDVVGRSWLDLLVPLDELETTRAALQQLKTAGGTVTFETRCRRQDGRFITIIWTASWSAAEQLIFGVARDVTDRKVVETERQFYLETIDSLEEAIFELDNMLILRQASHAWFPLSGFGVTESVGAPLLVHAHPEDREILRAACSDVLSGAQPQMRVRLRLLRKKGGEAWVDTQLLPHRDVYGTIAGVRGVMRDVTQAYLQERKIAQLALHDPLTKLPNRALFEDRLDVALVGARRSGKKVGLAFIDVDHFKQINDTLGHAMGDLVLQGLAQRLSAELRKGDTLSRWGGDEFVVLLPDVSNADEAAAVGKRLLAAALPVAPSDKFRVTLSIGLAVFPDHADSPETLMNQADRAMFKAKHDGRNNLQVFDAAVAPLMGPGRFQQEAS
jgi:diguanylate cyclase (GGDEF)-like protein/PAS domain S-box-containing protein